MNKHAEKSLGILAIIALIIYFFVRNSKPTNASAQDNTLGYVPPNERLSSLNSVPCACSSGSPQLVSSSAKAASTVSRQARF